VIPEDPNEALVFHLQGNSPKYVLEIKKTKRELFKGKIVKYKQRFKSSNQGVQCKMTSKKTIKVIKKSERISSEAKGPKTAGARDTAREMVQTVTNWVNELQQKRRTETSQALKSLLSESPRPSEA